MHLSRPSAKGAPGKSSRRGMWSLPTLSFWAEFCSDTWELEVPPPIRKVDRVLRGPPDSSAAHASSDLVKRRSELPRPHGRFHLSTTCSACRALFAHEYAEINLLDPAPVRHGSSSLQSITRPRREHCAWRFQPWRRQRAMKESW